jgi:hypothetical protein
MRDDSTFVRLFPNDSWTRVELFLLVYGRLPLLESDRITKSTLKLFLKKYEDGFLQSKTVDLEALYNAIKANEFIIY